VTMVPGDEVMAKARRMVESVYTNRGGFGSL